MPKNFWKNTKYFLNSSFLQTLVLVLTLYFAYQIGATQNKISEHLLSLEEIGKDPILQIYFDHASLDNPQNFSAQIHFQNVGSVPIYIVKYGISDFNTGTSRATGTPVTLFNGTVHQFNLGSPGVVAPGKEITHAIGPTTLKTPNGIPTIWVGVTFNRYPGGPLKCVELNYIPLKEYQRSPGQARECGPWWPDFEKAFPISMRSPSLT